MKRLNIIQSVLIILVLISILIFSKIDMQFGGYVIAVGIVSASCILGIVWIEITKVRLEE